jgi:hypothetical protein
VLLSITTLTTVPPVTTFLPEPNTRLISNSRFVSYVQVVLWAAFAPNWTEQARVKGVPEVRSTCKLTGKVI